MHESADKTLTVFAREIGLPSSVIGELVRLMQIRTVKIPLKTNAKGLTPRQVEILRERLRPFTDEENGINEYTIDASLGLDA